MLKKSLAFILGLCLLLVVCGCGGNETAGDSSSITQSVTELTDNRSIYKDYMLSGITPPFGTEWNSLTGTKTVFIQAAQGAVEGNTVNSSKAYYDGCGRTYSLFAGNI